MLPDKDHLTLCFAHSAYRLGGGFSPAIETEIAVAKIIRHDQQNVGFGRDLLGWGGCACGTIAFCSKRSGLRGVIARCQFRQSQHGGT